MSSYHHKNFETDNVTSGLTKVQLLEMARAGSIKKKDYIRKDGHKTWHRADTVKGIDEILDSHGFGTGGNYYKVLGVKRSATANEIRKAYRKLALKYHPDVNKEEDAAAKYIEVQEAYDTLSDIEKRRMYDQFGSAGPSAPGGNTAASSDGGGSGGGGNVSDPPAGFAGDSNPNDVPIETGEYSLSEVTGTDASGIQGELNRLKNELQNARKTHWFRWIARLLCIPVAIVSAVSIMAFLMGLDGGIGSGPMWFAFVLICFTVAYFLLIVFTELCCIKNVKSIQKKVIVRGNLNEAKIKSQAPFIEEVFNKWNEET